MNHAGINETGVFVGVLYGSDGQKHALEQLNTTIKTGTVWKLQVMTIEHQIKNAI